MNPLVPPSEQGDSEQGDLSTLTKNGVPPCLGR